MRQGSQLILLTLVSVFLLGNYLYTNSTSQQAHPEKALSKAELEKELKIFWTNCRSAPSVAAKALRRAEESAVSLWLPADNNTLADVAFAMTFWLNRERAPWLGDELKSPGVIYETATRLRDPGRRSILLRRAWHVWSFRAKGSWATPESMRLAYDTAINLMHFGRYDEARAVVEKALQASAGESLSDNEQLGLRYLKAKLMVSAGRPQEAARRLARIYEEARSKAQVPSGPNHLAWQVLISQELVDIYTQDCNPTELPRALTRAAQSDADILLGSPHGLNDDLLRTMLADLSAETQLFEPLLRCGESVPEIARMTLERLLVRREGWRFRRIILHAAASSKDAFVNDTLRSLADTRRVQAQLQLRAHDAILQKELEGLPIPENLSPPDGVDAVTRAWVELSAAAATLESNVVAHVQAQWKKENEAALKTLMAETARAIPPDAALLVYLELPDEAGKQSSGSLVFVVNRDRTVAWRLLKQDPVSPGALLSAASSIARRGVQLLDSQSNETHWKGPLREAGRILIDPIENLIQGKKKLFLLTSGQFRLLPWQVLIDREGRFFCDRASIRYIQSASELFSTAAKQNPANREAVLVGPVYNFVPPEKVEVPLSSRSISREFEPLAGIGEEIEAIRVLLSGARIAVRVLRDAEATEAALWRLQSPRVLHFAGHGFRVPPAAIGFEAEAGALGAQNFRWPFEFRSLLGGARYRTGIALSDANAGGRMGVPDGLLTAAEAADLNLFGTELVVLSACETGYPVDEDRTGAYDLALAFRLAGARSVVASLWRVDDRATAIFMTHFYKSLVMGRSVAEAAESARGNIRETPSFSDPFFWAGFEVFGENVFFHDLPSRAQPGAPK